MSNIELHNHDTDDDPPASVATDAEIEIAYRLRRQIEERYLASAAASPPLQRLGKGH